MAPFSPTMVPVDSLLKTMEYNAANVKLGLFVHVVPLLVVSRRTPFVPTINPCVALRKATPFSGVVMLLIVRRIDHEMPESVDRAMVPLSPTAIPVVASANVIAWKDIPSEGRD